VYIGRDAEKSFPPREQRSTKVFSVPLEPELASQSAQPGRVVARGVAATGFTGCGPSGPARRRGLAFCPGQEIALGIVAGAVEQTGGGLLQDLDRQPAAAAREGEDPLPISRSPTLPAKERATSARSRRLIC